MTERELCEQFTAAATADGWTVYPEQGDWDMLAVRHRVQVGIQAKITASTHMLLQALPTSPRTDVEGPQYRAVLFERVAGRTENARREHRNEIYALAQHLRLLVFQPAANRDGQPSTNRGWLRGYPEPNLTIQGLGHPLLTRWRLDFRHYRWSPEKPVWTPPFVPKLPAGVPNPRKVSAWSLAACELEKLYDARGWVCLDDARQVTEDQGGGWLPRSLLQRFFQSSGERVPGNRHRQTKFVRKSWNSVPSKKYPEAAEGLGMDS